MTIARIQHPGVVAVYDSGELEDGSVYLVMERLRGFDLAQLLDRYGRGTPKQVAEMLRQGSAALSAAHRAGVIHRDVKPQNVYFVDAELGFSVKLFDFGLAKSTEAERELTQMGLVVGTPAYMSPEQARGEPLDVRSDLYSWAAVTYEALVGRPAISGKDVARILANVLDAVPEPPSTIVPELPQAVDDAFETALSKLAAFRPPDIQTWVESFVTHLHDVPSTVAGWPASFAVRVDPETAGEGPQTLILPS